MLQRYYLFCQGQCCSAQLTHAIALALAPYRRIKYILSVTQLTYYW